MQEGECVKKPLLILIVMMTLSACKTPVVDVQHDPSFTYAAVAQSHFVVGGVVATTEHLDDITRIRFGDLLARVFSEERPELMLIRPGLLLKKTDNESFTRLLDGYRLTGVISEHDVDHVRRAFPAARYLLLSRIEMDHVSQLHDENETDVPDSEEDRRKGEFEQVRVDVSLTTTRQMGATLTIYDLHQHLLAWSGYVSQTVTNSNDSSHTFNKDRRWQEELIDSVVDGLIGLDEEEYPEAPSQTEVLEAIFEGFAENMPTSPKK